MACTFRTASQMERESEWAQHFKDRLDATRHDDFVSGYLPS